MFFKQQELLKGWVVSLRFTAEALEIATCPHILQLEPFCESALSCSGDSSHMAVGGEGKKIPTVTDKSYCVKL